MEKKPEQHHPDQWLKDIPLRSESEGYKPEEMITCRKCQRTNPPNRLDCIYCREELQFEESQKQFIKPALRRADLHLPGFNLIYLANLENWTDDQLREVSKMTRLTVSELVTAVQSRIALPLARAESEKETKIVAERLGEIGIKTTIFSDQMFELEKVPHRLRGLRFESESLKLNLFNNEDIVGIERSDLALIVVGGVFEKKLESVEKRRKKGENKILETSELTSDELVIDLYQKGDINSFRIFPKGFDFSCLGAEKKLLATENIKILMDKLSEFASRAEFNDDYLKVRESLSTVWTVEERNDSRGMRRKSFGSYNRETVTTTNNLLQFTKFSRLRYLLMKNS